MIIKVNNSKIVIIIDENEINLAEEIEDMFLDNAIGLATDREYDDANKYFECASYINKCIDEVRKEIGIQA